jgi:hypothetical protein
MAYLDIWISRFVRQNKIREIRFIYINRVEIYLQFSFHDENRLRRTEMGNYLLCHEIDEWTHSLLHCEYDVAVL